MKMSSSKNGNENKKFIKILQEKIFNMNSEYEIDNENQNPPKEEEIYEERENSDNYSPKINTKLKESIQLPLEIENNEKEPEKESEPQKEPEPEPEKEKVVKNNNTEQINNNKNDKIEERLSSINLVLCKIHGKSFLKINPTNFEIICEKCIEDGNKSKLEIKQKSNKDEEEEKPICFEHNNSKGSFYCDECKEFICKKCFADIHREHKCHLPKIIRNEFINELNEEIDNTEKLRPILNNSINDIKKIHNELKKQKDEIMKIPTNNLKIISTNNENEIEILKKKVYEKFLGIDNDIHDDYFTFNGIKEKNRKYIGVAKKMIEGLNKIKNNYELCGYHKIQREIIKEINNYINSSLNFINIRLNTTSSKYINHYEKIDKSLNLMNKEISNYENSTISSILTGRENKNIVLLRYIRFVHKEIQYFKNTLIDFASNDNVFLTGLVLCGLYIKRTKEEKEDLNILNQKKILVEITISTKVNQGEGEKLFSQKCELVGVKGANESCITINLEKGVKIMKEKLYLIKVENLSENNYTDLWIGSTGKNNKKDIQVIRCHNTGIQFLFKLSKGIQTDFDEFNFGIIAGILYSSNK
jgi:hypothetical protein